jgi:hypothetical protein
LRRGRERRCGPGRLVEFGERGGLALLRLPVLLNRQQLAEGAVGHAHHAVGLGQAPHGALGIGAGAIGVAVAPAGGDVGGDILHGEARLDFGGGRRLSMLPRAEWQRARVSGSVSSNSQGMVARSSM